MLSDNTIDKLLQPFIERQENLNNYVISIIAKRIMEIGKLEPSDIYRLTVLFRGGADVRKINEEIARVTNLQVKEVKSLIKEVAKNNYLDARPFYDYRRKSFIPFEKNQPLQRIVESISRQTEGTFKNLSRSTGFMLRDPQNPQHFIPTNVSNTYQRVIDEAIQSVQNGGVDFDTAMRRTMVDLNNSGLRTINYHTKSGRIYTQRLDTAVRRNLLGGVRAINQGVQDIVGEQFGADGKEISVHFNSAPDHEPIQGRQFTNAEFDKLQSEMAFESYPADGQERQYFEPIARAIGDWNCRHYTYSVILGVMKPNYSDTQLQEIIKKNHDGYTTPDGTHMTMYECTQMQRKYETAIRHAKDGFLMAKTAENKDLQEWYKAKVSALTKQYNQFSKDCGLSPKTSRLYVNGYN